MSQEESQLASTAITSMMSVEEMLGEILEYIPYLSEHEKVWSPKCATVLLEACSAIDSIWKSELRIHKPDAFKTLKSRRITIEDYRRVFRLDVAWRWVVLWAADGIRIDPFKEWRDSESKTTLPWWKAYNKVKHDRLEHRAEATLGNAVCAVAALRVAVMMAKVCTNTIVEHRIATFNFDAASSFPTAMTSADLLFGEGRYCVVEATSKLMSFSWNVGRDQSDVLQRTMFGSDPRSRFCSWLARHPRIA